MTDVSAPYLSIVVCSRNDNHGGDLSKRMEIFVNGLIYQCNKHQLACELIMVEWNPPESQPYLSDVLPQTRESDYLNIRYVIVPPNIHRSLNFSERLPLFQMIAKNVGIRRSNAPFVLCTNIDLLFSDDLFAFLAKKKLKSNCFYRAVRRDIPASVDSNWTVPKQLHFAKSNYTKALGKEEWFGLAYKVFQKLMRISLPTRLKEYFAALLIATLDKEACGDFTLMSKQDWEIIGGYPELEVYSLHIDSMGIIAAAALGFTQVVLPKEACTYHIAHQGGWEFSDRLQKLMFYTNKPVLDWWSVHELGVQIIGEGRTYSINGDSWGFSEMEFDEN